MAVALAFALLLGFFNGYLVLRTGLPSFIVTLGTLYILRGATIGVTRLLTGRTQIGGLDKAPGFDPPKRSSPATSTLAGHCSRSRSCGGWSSPRWRPGSCCVPRSATGSSAAAATSRQRATSACRSTGSRSCCSWRPPLAACLVAIIQAITFTGADVLARHGPGVLRHHRGGRRRHAADGRLRFGHRRRVRRADLRHGQQGIVFAGSTPTGSRSFWG